MNMKFTLKQARNYRGLSQEQVAKKIGSSVGMYGRYERGEVVMRVDDAEKFAKAVEIPFDHIIFYPQSMKIS